MKRTRLRTKLSVLGVTGAVLLLTGLDPDARGDSVVQFMTAKSLPAATVAVIDPESGTSQGTGGSDVNIAVGDIILFRFSVASAPASAVDGIQSYLTEYVPPGTQLVGARMVDAFGNTVEPRRAGLALDGCAGGAACNNFNAVPCSSGTGNFNTTPGTGSIAQVYADTGIFATTSASAGPTPNNAFLTLDNGLAMSSTLEPRAINPEIVQLLNDTSAPYNAHNDWDWYQVRAYGGSGGSVSDGDGNTPFGYGSPVAGPDTYYRYEATCTANCAAHSTSTRVELNNVVGPWSRVKYPGSQIGAGAASLGSTSTMTRVGVDTSTGLDVTPASPVNASAVRFALGEARVGEIRYVELALRVTQVPIDPTFGTGAGNVDCGEVFGSDITNKAANTGGANNPWPEMIGHPQCVFLRLKLDLDVDQVVATGSSRLTYTIRGKNLSVAPETNARVRFKFVGSDQAFVSSSPVATSTFACPGETNKTCKEFALGTLAPSAEFTITVTMDVGGVGGGTNVDVAQYLSNELTAIDANGYSTTAMTVVQPVAQPQIVLQNTLLETANFAAAGSTTWAVNGTVTNSGTTNWTSESFTLFLPAGWSLTGNRIVVGGTNYTCTTGSTPICSSALTYTSTQTRAISFALTIPGGAATGLYDLDISTRGSQGTFGSFDTLFHKAVTVNVGAVRTPKPTVNCPIGSTANTISGTSVANAAIDLLFNLMSRGSGTATGAGVWTIANFLPGFGELYGGLEVRATATAAGQLRSVPSDSCIVSSVRQCSDGIDNDGDGLVDFPADPGCTSLGDNDETNPTFAQCQDGGDNDGDGLADYPLDPQCTSMSDNSESGGLAQCQDGLDNDGDGLVDLADPDCAGNPSGREAHLLACQDGLDNDADGLVDFPNDLGCHSAFDDDEFDSGSSTLDTKARLLLAVDSSGSMNMNTCADTFTGGDGTTECPGSDVACTACANNACGNAEPDDSRLYQVTSGLANVVAAFGEVEYSLMRFHQRATDFGCPTAAASLRAGGWQGGGIAPCGGGFNAGDLLVSFAQDNESTILTWMDHDSDYTGVPPIGTDWEIRGSGTTPLGGILTSANTYLGGVRASDLKAACRPYTVVLVTDGGETCGGSPTAAAATLLANGFPTYVIGFATPDPTVIANLNAIAAAGGTTSAIFVDDEAALSAALAQIIEDSIVYERCNGADDDCDTLIDEDFPDKGDACDNGELGQCYATGQMVCSANGLTTVCNAPPGVPQPEVCNGLDDDCDGQIDDGLGASCTCNPLPEICNGRDDNCNGQVDEGVLPGVGDSCGTSIGDCEPGAIECLSGVLTCVGGVGPQPEVCGGGDEDCDTFVDEVVTACYAPADTGCSLGTGTCLGTCSLGSQACVSGAPGECVGDVHPVPEKCNGLDEDCDGTIDDGFDVGAACDNGLQGACFATGQIVCDAAGGTTCTAPNIPPGLETCNGLDDDCDGQIDEDLGAPIGNSCGVGGSCGVGVFECTNGQVVCVGSQTGTPEVCNGVDDDCDTLVDEDIPSGGDCVPTGFEQYGDTGACEFGHLECIGGSMSCRDYVGPSSEIPCNGVDEDCDGNDAQTCPGEQACLENGCRNPCASGEFPCPFGFNCETQPDNSRYCVPDPCASMNCPPGFGCDPSLDPPACVDLCASVNCPTGTQCQNGLCQDCFTLGCPDGEICIRDATTDLGVCTTDLCAGVTCDPGQFCRDGDCVAEGCDPTCGDNEVCLEGQCVADPCNGRCAADQICNYNTGTCQDDLCGSVMCPPGDACNPYTGLCAMDPCRQIDCGAGYDCVILPDGTGTCFNPPPPPTEIVYAGGGGCAAGGSSSGGALALVGVALALVRRRRRG